MDTNFKEKKWLFVLAIVLVLIVSVFSYYNKDTIKKTLGFATVLMCQDPATGMTTSFCSSNGCVCDEHGDINRDGIVNLKDLSILFYYWGQNNPSLPCADINRDGIVGLRDLSILMYNWQKTFAIPTSCQTDTPPGRGTRHPPTPPSSGSYTVGGTISGLGSGKTLVIRNNGGDDKTLSDNGSFTFDTSLTGGSSYAVDIYEKVDNQNCVVTNSVGTISSSNITNINISCDNFHMFDTVDAHNGNFATGYSNGIAGADAFCQTERPSGVTGNYKALISDGVNRIACTSGNCVTSEGSEHIGWILNGNTDYYRLDNTTKIGTTDPIGLFFTLANFDNALTDTEFSDWTGLYSDWTSSANNNNLWTDESDTYNGEFGLSDYGDTNFIDNSNTPSSGGLNIACVEQSLPTAYTYNVAVSVSGLASGRTVVLQNNGGNNLTVTTNGSHNFSTKLADNAPYNVTILTQPVDQVCSVTNGPGLIYGNDTSNISVVCQSTQPTPTFNPASGFVDLGATINIISSLADNIYYSTDGGWTWNDQASTPFVMTGATTRTDVDAYATRAGYIDSAHATSTYIRKAMNISYALAPLGSSSFSGYTYIDSGSQINTTECQDVSIKISNDRNAILNSLISPNVSEVVGNHGGLDPFGANTSGFNIPTMPDFPISSNGEQEFIIRNISDYSLGGTNCHRHYHHLKSTFSLSTDDPATPDFSIVVYASC